ncbi:hypothetical protein SAMN05444858_101522 [Micromonospora avicenniae]|uniref:Uncharacterized protein n=1 Tax=Micromonospora avicenniae TaxID=1198245 RepID=A0A1N6QXQ8_9ACTN|nr:hypothetical protein SAMN05444858_101522 [Micromonospora avicenniae]
MRPEARIRVGRPAGRGRVACRAARSRVRPGARDRAGRPEGRTPAEGRGDRASPQSVARRPGSQVPGRARPAPAAPAEPRPEADPPAERRQRGWARRSSPRRPSTVGSRGRRGRCTSRVARSRSHLNDDTPGEPVVAAQGRTRRRGRDGARVVAVRLAGGTGGRHEAAGGGRGPTSRRRRVRRGLRHAGKCYRLPRASCSRSMASNRALKLPFPKPSEPCRSISSKKTVGRSCTGLVKIWSR